MRIWSLHPRYLDAKGLVALWRETLLAQKVLAGETMGYKHHPQLTRFRETEDPVAAIAEYLESVCDEADRRGYHFDRSKIGCSRLGSSIGVTIGQISYEKEHLKKKLKVREPSAIDTLLDNDIPELHPLFSLEEGGVEPWEIT